MPGASPEPLEKNGDTWNIWRVLKIGLPGHPKSSKTLDHDLYSIEIETHGDFGYPHFRKPSCRKILGTDIGKILQVLLIRHGMDPLEFLAAFSSQDWILVDFGSLVPPAAAHLELNILRSEK
jgi:hypothetical protein